VPLDPADAEQRYAGEPTLGADVLYERRWALTLLDAALGRLSAEFAAANKAEDFEVLKDWLIAARGEIPYTELAQRLGTNEGAARVTVHRLRKRYRELFRETIAETVANPDELNAEMRHLASILATSA
jgi:DNA-directed RNA polymerase specialized sigma24 family protein